MNAASNGGDVPSTPISPETMLCYVENGKHHLPGPNPGTPYTLCGLDAGAMTRDDHPITHAALWCSDCFKERLT